MSGHLSHLLAAVNACTGNTSRIPPDNWEWKGRAHLAGECECSRTASKQAAGL